MIENLSTLWDDSAPWIPELITDYAKRDIGRREIDIGIRAARPTESWLAGRRIGDVDYAIYRAARLPPNVPVPGWIGIAEEHPSSPAGHWQENHREAAWTLRVNMSPMGLPLVRQGLARMAMPCFVGDSQSDLVRDGKPLEKLRHERWLVVHQDQRHRPHIRSAIEALATFFTQMPASP